MQDKGTVRLVDMENASQKFTKLLSPFKIGKMELKVYLSSASYRLCN